MATDTMMAAETMMLSPLPRRGQVLSTPRSLHPSLPTSPEYSPSEIDMKELSLARPFWYDDVEEQATRDLHAALGYERPAKTLPDGLQIGPWLPSFDLRCLSSASTCANSVASPEPPSCVTPPLSPEIALAALQFDSSDGFESPTQQPLCPPGALDKSSWLQARKVFVGGIPQHIDQNGLYHMFSKIGKVKKAWLQLFHADRASAQPKEKKHRGFGFVIFYEKAALDQLLGDAFARFITFPDDVKLEVKRAIGKNAQTPDEAQSAGKAKKVESAPTSACQTPSPAGPLAQQSPATQQKQPQPKGMPDDTTKELEVHSANGMSPASPQIWQCVAALPQAWQRGASPALVARFQNYINLPCIPPFPGVQPSPVQWPMAPAVMPSCPPPDPQPNFQTVANTVLGNLVGQQIQRPLTPQELAQALEDAQPDHYDD